MGPVFAGLAAACTAGTPVDTDDPGPPPTPACPSFADPLTAGVVPSPPATELSGIAVGDGRIWVHNDSGEGPEVFSVGLDGALRATWTLAGVTAVDFEDIARAPGPDGLPWIWVGDIGDNAGVRDTVSVHRFREPPDDAGGEVVAERIELLYPDGPHDAETLFVDPEDGALTIVTKSLDGVSGVYQVLLPRPGVQPMIRVGQLIFGEPPLGVATFLTGGDLGPHGLVLRTYLTEAYVWPAGPGDALADLLTREPCPVEIAGEAQGEAIGWGPDGSLWTVGEGANPEFHHVPLEAP